MFEIYDLFTEFDIDTICVSDFSIITSGVRVDNIHKTENGEVQIWAGNPDTDEYAEELVLDKAEKRRVFEEILENY